MAVEWEVEGKIERGSVYKFAPDDIVVKSAENGRHDKPDIEALIADIEKRGQDTPVTVRRDGKRPVLVFGYQRLRAIKEINRRNPELPPRPVLAVYKQLTPLEAFLANIAENRQRAGVTPIDDAHNIKRLMNVYGFSETQVVEHYFPAVVESRKPQERIDARRWVRERMGLIGLTPNVEKAVRDGRVKLHTAIKVNKLPAEKQDELVAGNGWVKGREVAQASAPKKPPVSTGYTPPEYVPNNAGLEAENYEPDSEVLMGALESFYWSQWITKEGKLAIGDMVLAALTALSAKFALPDELMKEAEAYRAARQACHV